MSTSSHFFVALCVVAAAAALPILVTRPSPQDPAAPFAPFEIAASLSARQPVLDAALTAQPEAQLQTQMAGLRDMRTRLAAAKSDDERSALLAESEQLLSDGVALMRRLKRNLPVSESGTLIPDVVTAAQSADIEGFLGLTELLVELKADCDALLAPPHPTRPAAPLRILPNSATSTSAKGLA